MLNTNTSNANLTSVSIDPNETDWKEVKDLGLDPEPVGITADEDTKQE